LIATNGDTMTTPENELVHNARLTKLARALRDLHKQLIHVETQYFGAVGSPLQHLQLVANHPHFAWLQKLSGLMAQMDERLDEPEPVGADEALAYRRAIEDLIGPSEQGDMEFRAKYNALLHDGPDTVMAHGAVRSLLAGITA
jgi:hypothetical protein